MITLLFFARLAELTGVRRMETMASNTPQALADARPEWDFLRDRSLRVAVNRRWAHWDTPLSDGDEVAFLPPWASP
ncbi:MAG: MoaD/ThiS family protein [Elusimicrobia bacterium]|nr:MoaD/ThiS family protein [Elusimicrobiota bacterium]